MFWTVTLSLLEGLVVLLRIFAMTLLFSSRWACSSPSAA